MNRSLFIAQGSFRHLSACLFFILCVNCAQGQVPAITIRSGLPCGPAAPARQVINANGIYIASFVSPTRFYTSTDAVSWSQITGPAVFGFPALAYGAGLFVCAGDSGKIFSSPDGLTWTRRSSGTMNGLLDVQFLQGAFYATGAGATLLHSTDGLTWDAISTGEGSSSDSYQGIVYGNGNFLLNSVDATQTAVLYLSADLTPGSWTAVPLGPSGNLRFLKGRFYYFSQIQTSVSSDGSGWQLLNLPPTTPEFPIGIPVDGFDDGSQIYLLSTGGSHFSYIFGAIFSSSDGITFNVTQINVPCSGGLYAGPHYFVYSQYGLVMSDDGLNYHVLGINYVSMASNGSGYVGVGYPGWLGWSNSQGLIGSSPDFINWTDRTPPPLSTFQPTPPMMGVVYDGNRYVAAGASAVATSPDGITWSLPGYVPEPISTMAYSAGVYVTAGEYGLYYSTDGLQWSTVPNPSPQLIVNSISRVKYVNGYFFAMGDGITYNSETIPTLLLSSDGIHWNDISPHLSFIASYINDVVYNGAAYYFMGMKADASGNPAGFFSVSPTDINDPDSYANSGSITSPPAGAMLGSGTFAWSNGHFAGGVTDINHDNNGYLLYSTDGIHWDNTPLNAATAINSIIAAGDTFRMMGTSNVTVTVDFGGIPLPVSLLDFNAAVLNGTTLLTWKTAQEENSSRFVVQRSLDAVRWDSIGVVAAAGQSSTVQDYRFVDAGPKPGYDYYRLLIIDRDDLQKISPVKRVQIGQAGVMKVYPNPAQASATVELPESGEGLAMLYNAAGLRVLQQEFNAYTITLQLQGMPAGIYHLWVQQNGKQYREEILHR